MRTALIHQLKPAVLLLVALCLLTAIPALAVDTPVQAQITVTPDEMSVPGPVEVSISVKNISGADLTRPVTLYAPNGQLVSGFGQNGSATLKADAQMNATLQTTVTQDMLDKGEMTYMLRWQDDAGQELALPLTAAIRFNGEKSGLRVVRTISPEVVRSNQSVKVTYELTNTGAVSISNIQVREKLSRTPKTLKNLAIGATTKVEFTAKMGNTDLVSGAEISFRPAGTGASETAVIEDQVIPLAVKGLNVELSVDQTAVNIGETVRLIMTARNEGNITYTNVTATDSKLGTVFENVTIPAYTTITEEKAITISEPSSFKLKLTLADNTGMTNSYDTNSVSVSAYDPEKELKLTLLLTSDKESITSAPEDVSMTVVVTNSSNVECKKVEITQNGVAIYTIPSLAAGQSMTVKRDFTVSQAGAFRFTATTKDTIGNTVRFDSNTLTLNYARATLAPTATPAPTIPPLETLPPVEYKDTGSILRTVRNSLYTATIALAAVTAVVLALFVASSIVRARKRHQSDSAFDHLDLAERRDYAQAPESADESAPAPRREKKPDGDAPAEDAAEPVQTSDGGFRMSRDRQTEDFPVWRESADSPAAPDADTPADEGVPDGDARAIQDEPVSPRHVRDVAPAAPDAGAAESPIAAPTETPAADHSRASLPDRRRRHRG